MTNPITPLTPTQTASAESQVTNLFQKDHGANAEAGDLQRAETVAKIEESTGDLNEGAD